MNKVHLIDCLKFMKDLPNKHYDLAIVDPPYGEVCDITSKGNRHAARNGFSDLYINHTANKWNVAPSKEFFDELFRVSERQIIWGGNFFNLPPTGGLVLWNKMQRNFSFGDGELAWVSPNLSKSMRIFDFSRGRMQQEKRIHITQKPVALYKWLLQTYAKEGFSIFDSHVGSGSIRIACYDMGFNFEGCEIDNKYWEAQEDRFQEHISQGLLFEPSEMVGVNQGELL